MILLMDLMFLLNVLQHVDNIEAIMYLNLSVRVRMQWTEEKLCF